MFWACCRQLIDESTVDRCAGTMLRPQAGGKPRKPGIRIECNSFAHNGLEKQMADNQEYSTIIGADANFKGELTFESAAKFLGKIEGSIASKGKVLVGDGARCKATFKAKEISVEGDIEGNVEAGDRVEL